MKAVNDFVIIKPIKEERVSKGGFILTDSIKTDLRYIKGLVYSVGNMVQGVKDGDTVHFDRIAGEKNFIEYEGEEFNVIRLRDIVIVE